MIGPDALKIDPAAVVAAITGKLKEQVLGTLRRKGAVLGLSGGVDSSVCAALCARAFGGAKVLSILMPERDSSPDALRLGTLVAKTFDLPLVKEDIRPALEGMDAYARQIDAIRRVVPAYGEGWKCKLTLPSAAMSDRIAVTMLTVQGPDGKTETVRLPADAYLQLVAATNFKQRIRKMTEYYHADRLHYAVCGTPNRLEYDLGFFVKQGDGMADVKPIAHLFKTQVYQIAEYLGVPEEIRSRPPTTDTFSMPQTQDEFYFALPYDRMDLCLLAFDRGLPAADVAPAVGLTAEQAERVYKDIKSKRRAAAYLHLRPLLVEPVDGAR